MIGKYVRDKSIKAGSYLFISTVIGQMMTVGSLPFLAKIYSPGDFGLFAIFMASLNIVSIPATGRLELAFVLIDDNEDASGLFIGLLATSFVYSLIVAASAAFFLSGFEDSILLVATFSVSVFSISIIKVCSSWHTRSKNFKLIACTKLIQTMIIIALQLVILATLSYRGLNGLVFGFVFSQVFLAVVLTCYSLAELEVNKGVSFQAQLRGIVVRYIDFPKFTVPAGLLNSAARQSLILVTGFFFSREIVGFIEMANRVVRMPTLLLIQSMEKVLVSRLGENIRKGISNIPLMVTVIRTVFLASVIIAVGMFLFVEQVFVVLLGDIWLTSASYSLIILPVVLTRLVVVPVCKLYIFGKQKIGLYWQAIYCLGSIAAIAIGGVIDNPSAGLLTFMLFGTCMYVLYMALCLKYAGGSLLSLFLKRKWVRLK